LLTSNLFNACALFAAAQTFVWFQLYSQYIWGWWEGKAFIAAIIYGIPASMCFWHGTRLAMLATNEAWSSRLLGFGMSYLTFPLLTWWFLNETMFTHKTMLCVALSVCIVLIQVFWR
jgi:hypothetical protein